MTQQLSAEGVRRNSAGGLSPWLSVFRVSLLQIVLFSAALPCLAQGRAGDVFNGDVSNNGKPAKAPPVAFPSTNPVSKPVAPPASKPASKPKIDVKPKKDGSTLESLHSEKMQSEVSRSFAKGATEAEVATGAKASMGGKQQKPNGWQLEVRNDKLGRLSWFVSSNGAKVITPIMSFLLPPNTEQIYAFNPDTKLYCEYGSSGALQRKIASIGALNSASKFKYKPWRKIGDSKIQGLSVKVYRRAMIDPPASPRNGLTSAYSEEVCIAPMPNYKFVKRIFKPMAEMFSHQVPVDGVILKRTTYWDIYRNGKLIKSEPKDDLEVLQCREIHMDAKELTLPADFKKAKLDTDILPEEVSFRFH